jgi:threonine aldolase
LNFASDNWAGASEPVIAALAEAARRGGPAYGADPLTRGIEDRFAEIFEHEVAVFLVASGTAANALGLSAYARPGGVIFCYREAHILVDEAGASEFFGGGAKVFGIDGVGGKLTSDALRSAMARFPDGAVHHGQPAAVSLTQLTELGTAYSAGEIAAVAEVARSRSAALHMDGARFAGAVAALGVRPADVTWKAGVDVLSFGGTKNGCVAAEAVVFFNPADARHFAFARQRAGQGFSKNWFIAAQFAAYLHEDHWLALARHANAMAARLAEAIASSGIARLGIEPAANEVFVVLPAEVDTRLRASGAHYHPWPADSLPPASRPAEEEVLVRLVTSWQTAPADVDRFSELLSARS